MLEIQDYKDRVAGICEQFTSALPYEPDQVEAETWQELADELAETIREMLVEKVQKSLSDSYHRSQVVKALFD